MWILELLDPSTESSLDLRVFLTLLFVCLLIVECPSREYFLHGDAIMSCEVLKYLTDARQIRSFEQGGVFIVPH